MKNNFFSTNEFGELEPVDYELASYVDSQLYKKLLEEYENFVIKAIEKDAYVTKLESLATMIIDSESADDWLIPVMYHSWLSVAKNLDKKLNNKGQ